ncbi:MULTISPECIES: C1 family peptidase [unclassified Legionella]|uniref:C1 family peptidase n=1 Tax=unclassified Legionella TaxID=2622702 RepID=UPI001056466F|nr:MULTISPECIES: C1 family peptidase [unclassified Legionella]MDI9818055.1 C1 family peptidase [Legionella sp. PL877]
MKLAKFALFSMVVSGSLAAQDVKIVGTISKTAKIPAAQVSRINAPQSTADVIKQIKFLNIQLPAKAKQALADKAKNALAHTKQFALDASALTRKYPAKVELGMNNVPVLDQGMHGTCVTFANTAAIDAALNKGDYISQLCQLELGRYLENNGYAASGWDGSWGRTVLNQMELFGIVNKEQQAEQNCGGISNYPADERETPDAQMTPEEYRQLSENMGEEVLWSPVLDVYQALSERVDTNKTINEIKAALNSGDRLTFGVLLLDFDLGFMGAVGSNKSTFDTWVLTPEIARDVYLRPEFGGHEMIITGYDDNAVAIDDQGREHRGLLTLRNSWGNQVGDRGNFYMSYDYFKLLVLEVQRIRGMENMVQA